MKEFITAFDDSFKTSSKIIVSESNGKSYSTLKNVLPKDFKESLKQHFLGIKRLGVSPEIKGQEDLILFAGIDIDGKAKKDSKELSTEEKYQIALNLQKAFFEKYKINTLIEQSKSKGFHLFVFFKNPVNRNLIQKILENLVTEVTDRTITNGDIEIFPKGKKGLAFVESENMDTIKNPLEKIETCKNNNLSTLLFLESLKDSPLCVAKAALNWTEGERNSLTLAIAGVLKKVSKVSVDEAIDIITKIVEYNNDEELSSRITGMRQGELMDLTWDSINWVTRKITVDKNFTHGRVGTPKTGKIRKVDMSLELVKILKEWRLACPKGEHNLVFPNSDGGYQDANNMIKRRFKPALNRAGINHLRFHDLRHTYASLLLDNIVEQTTIVDARKFGT